MVDFHFGFSHGFLLRFNGLAFCLNKPFAQSGETYVFGGINPLFFVIIRNKLKIGFEIIFFCSWLYYILSLYILQDFFNKNSKLIINIQIVSIYLDYLIIYEYLFDIRAANYIVIFLSIPLFFCKLMV